MSLAIPSGSDRLPPGRHQATVAEVEAAFANAYPSSASRGPLFEQWRLLSAAIERIVEIQDQWLDGSYVTTKENPADIDLVSHFDGPALDALDPIEKTLLIGLIHGHQSRDIHACDSFYIAIYPAGHPARAQYEAALRYWDNLFGRHRDGDPKGYVEVKA